MVRLRLARFGRKVRQHIHIHDRIKRSTDIGYTIIWINRVYLRCLLQNLPYYRIFAADSRFPRDGRQLEQLGYYDPAPGKMVARPTGVRILVCNHHWCDCATLLLNALPLASCLSSCLQLRMVTST